MCASAAVPPTDGNTGGVVASIIVVLLVLASVAVILYFYLRTRQTIKATTASETGAGFSNDVYESGSTVSEGIKCHSSILFVSVENKRE